jgi:hypothetical protein
MILAGNGTGNTADANLSTWKVAVTRLQSLDCHVVVHVIGVERGPAQWRVVLRDQGFVAFTEVTWLRDDPPGEPKDSWKQAYPAISSRAQNERTIQPAGYRLLHHFTLPQSDWWDEYYGPIEKKLPALRRTCEDDPEALRVLETEEEEIRLYRRYARYYEYVFYIAQKADGWRRGA